MRYAKSTGFPIIVIDFLAILISPFLHLLDSDYEWFPRILNPPFNLILQVKNFVTT
jgi:hypothetical protein